MKKCGAIPLYVLAASILLSALILAGLFRNRASEPADDSGISDGAYATSLNWLSPAIAAANSPHEAIRNLVLARTVVPADYFRYLDEDMVELVEAYNDGTANLKSQYTEYARASILGLFQNDRADNPDRPSLLNSEALICEAVAHAAHCALYRNASQLFFEDPAAAWIVAGEGGGSGGVWYTGIHTSLMIGEALKNDTEAYFLQTDALLDRLDALCAGGETTSW